MAIANPEESTDYCTGTSGAKVEWQTPDRTVLKQDYPWDGEEFNAGQVPLRFTKTATLGTFVETLNLSPGDVVSTANALTLNTYYSFVVSGSVTLSGAKSYDACFFVDISEGSTVPSDRLTTNDPQFENVFFDAATRGDVEFNPLSEYSIGYIGNNAPVQFTLASGGFGVLEIAIYENNYRLLIVKENETSTTTLFDETRQRPYLSLNIACGGDCPTRTSVSCECEGTRSCYYDNGEGTITKIFEGSK